ncbi:MAG: tRNA pseudouridine(55) synthase TruB [Coriobacteriia bacterium]|nr:tRNA pseudouridine(55) synthase TruB [Coriobacteriia bacterium]
MIARRGATDLAGVLLVDKPAGPTSHDVVATLRRATGERRIGHAGTLDPMATGLLLVLVGRATRLERYLSGHDKSYDARIVFGTATDTLDADGEVTETRPVDGALFDRTRAAGVLASFVGPAQQMPPAYSAIKRDGVAAHRLARAGKEPDLEPRGIVVHEATLIAVHPDERAWDVSFSVSKGTYIRSLARDVGLAAGTVAHLGALRRTAIGAVDVTAAHTIDALSDAGTAGRLPALFTDPVALLGFPAAVVDPASARDGRPLSAEVLPVAEGECVAVTAGDKLIGVYRRSGSALRAETVLDPGIDR